MLRATRSWGPGGGAGPQRRQRFSCFGFRLDRGRYAGPVGWIDQDGDGEWVIALRCARIDDDGTITAYAGAGIVTDSDPESELAETRMKFRPIADALR